MVKQVNTLLPMQYYVRNLTLADSIWRYKNEIQELGTKLGTGEVYGVMCRTDIQELDTLLLIIENEDALIEFLEQAYKIIEEDYTFVDAVPLTVAMKMGFQEYMDKNNNLVKKG